MINFCKDCIYNNDDDFCDKTYRDDLNEVIKCDYRIKNFKLSFYYDEISKQYKVVAFLNENGEILTQKEIPQEQIIRMLKREKETTKNNIIENTDEF